MRKWLGLRPVQQHRDSRDSPRSGILGAGGRRRDEHHKLGRGPESFLDRCRHASASSCTYGAVDDFGESIQPAGSGHNQLGDVFPLEPIDFGQGLLFLAGLLQRWLGLDSGHLFEN